MIKNPVYLRTAAITGIVLALALLLAGGFRSYKVYDADAGDFGILTFHRISDLQMVVDTTFSGVILSDGKLISTYDRTVTKGKRACPT